MLSFQRLVNGPKCVNHAAVAVGGKIYSFGGYCSDTFTNALMNVNIFNTAINEWFRVKHHAIESCPPNLYGHSAVVYKNLIYIWGGLDRQNQHTTKVYCFDTDTLKWRPVVTTGLDPMSTDGHSACVIDNFMYIFGGFESGCELLLKTLHRLDLDTYKWESVRYKGTPPAERDFHTASAIGNRMYIFGGRTYQDDMTEEVYHNQIIYFDTSTLTWERPEVFGLPPSGRRSHSAVVYNEEIYIIGGCGPDFTVELQHLNDAHKFNPVKNQWTELSIKKFRPCPRRRHCSVVIGDQLYLFGGSSPYQMEEEMFPPRLREESDIFIMDFFPSLKRLSQLKLIQYEIPLFILPRQLQQEVRNLQSTETKINYTR